jgi:hypothetical protein
VAAIAAKLFDLNPSLTPAQVKSILMSTGARIQDLDVTCGCEVNAYNALLDPTVSQPPPPVRLTVTRSAGGKVSDLSGAIDCGARCSATLPPGTKVTLTASAGSGYRFAGWRGACSGIRPTCTLTLSADTDVTATFARAKARVVVRKAGTGRGAVTLGGASCGVRCTALTASVEVGKVIRLTAKPARDSRFARWGGFCTGTRTTCRLTVTRSLTVTAVFARTRSGQVEDRVPTRAGERLAW